LILLEVNGLAKVVEAIIIVIAGEILGTGLTLERLYE